MISDYPGKTEARTGISLTGKTGDEVNRHLDGVDLPLRSEWFIDCLIKDWREDGEYVAADIERDAPELLANLARVKPTIICTLGRASMRWVLNADVDLDEVQGMPWYRWLCRKCGQRYARRPSLILGETQTAIERCSTCEGVVEQIIVFPCYNPAAGFRVPDIQAKVWDGFRQLGFLFADKVSPRELFHDEYPKPQYVRLTSPLEVSEKLFKTIDVNVDSEGLPGRVWSLQFTTHPGEGYLIRETDHEALAAFFWGLQRWMPTVTYHGSLHDFAIMRELMTVLGIPLDILYDLKFDDTQIMAYVLQLEPLGLKPNGVRHCGMQMREYLEVIGDAQHIHATTYLTRLFDAEHADWRQRCHEAFEDAQQTPLIDAKTGKRKRNKQTGEVQYRRVTKAPKLPMSSLHKAAKRVLRSENPFKLWQDQDENVLVAAYNREVSE